jgi:hypothetical protein
MSVMKRKLFNREARDELRRMGGIMASSEPLMMAAQAYAPGGVVEPRQVFTPRSGLGSNIEYTYADFLQENGLNDTPQAREMFVKYQQYMESQVARGQLTNPQITEPLLDRPPQNLNEPPVTSGAPSTLAAITAPDMSRVPIGIEALARDATYPSSAMMASVPVTPSEELITSATDPAVLAAAQSYGARPSEEDAFAEIESLRSRIREANNAGDEILVGTLTTRLNRLQRRLGVREAEKDVVEAVVGIPDALKGFWNRMVTAGIDPDLAAERLRGLNAKQAAQAAAEAEREAKLAEAQRPPVDLSEIDDGTATDFTAVPKAEAAEEVAETVVEEETTTPQTFPDLSEIDDGTGTDFTAIPKKADEILPEIKKEIEDADTEEKFDSVFDKYVKKFSEILGEDPEKAEKDQGFAMAIFGATLASTGDFGQATANMLETLRGDAATRQERKDKIKMLALQAGLDEESERRKLARLDAQRVTDYEDAIKLYEAKLKIKDLYDDPSGFLDTAEGRAALQIYLSAMGDENLNEEDRLSSALARGGPLVQRLLQEFPGLGGDGLPKQGGGNGADWFNQPVTSNSGSD